MIIKRTIILLLASFGMFSCSISASQEYHVVQVWPEVPQGWHFYHPRGVAVDKSDNVYIGDSDNHCVKKFDSEGRFITQWGSPGPGDGQFRTISNVRVGSSGIVYVVDREWLSDEGRIQKFTPYGQFIGVFERRTPDANTIKYPLDLATDDKGNILVLAVEFRLKTYRTYGVRVEKYSPEGEFISQWGAEPGSGDGQFQLPGAIDVDAKGDIYIADGGNHRVQKFDSSGRFLTKWGAWGEGDGFFSRPTSIAIDESGNVWVVDDYFVQKFTPEGEFFARWKTTKNGRSRLALDSHSNAYVTCEWANTVMKFDKAGNVLSEWKSAGSEDGQFAEPGSIASNSSGHIVVADVGHHRIQRLTSEGQFVSMGGYATWYGVCGLATDASGNLYIAWQGSDEIQKYDPDGKLICRWGSTGSGDGQFQCPVAIAVGPSGNVYVADTWNCRVQKFTSNGTFLAKWGTEGAGDGQFNRLFFIAADGSDNVWVGDQLGKNGTHRMQKFDANGRFLAKWTRKIMTPPPVLSLYAAAVAVDSSGNSYYAFEDRIEKYDAEGDLVGNYGQEDSATAKLEGVRAMCVDNAGFLYYITDASRALRKFDSHGKLDRKWTAEIPEGKERFPNGPFTVDGTGNIYVSDSRGSGTPIWKLSSDGKPVAQFQIEPQLHEDRFSGLGGVAVDDSGKIFAVESVDVDWHYGVPSIKTFDPNGKFITTWDVRKMAEGKIKYPARIAVDGSGNMYVTDKTIHCVHKLGVQGNYINSWGSKGTGDGQFDSPEGIAVDGSGQVYVCDRQNSRIQKFDSDGKFLAKWGKEGSGDGEFHFPAAVAIDKEGYVFVADSDNNRIQKFTPEGKFLTDWGEFGEAPGQFRVPLGIAVDASGNVYVSDSHNHRIQKFAPVPSR